MPSYNKVQLIGNLTRDPEVRYTPKGSAVGEISLAINRKYKTEGGESKEEVTFVDCTAWGKTAELIGQYLHKGSCLFIEGRLSMDAWEDKTTGQKRSKLKVTIEGMQFLDGKPQQGGQQQQRPAARSAPTQNEQPPQEGMEDDDIPF